MLVVGLLVIVVVVFAAIGVVAFNRLVRYRNLVADGWAGPRG